MNQYQPIVGLFNISLNQSILMDLIVLTSGFYFYHIHWSHQKQLFSIRLTANKKIKRWTFPHEKIQWHKMMSFDLHRWKVNKAQKKNYKNKTQANSCVDVDVCQYISYRYQLIETWPQLNSISIAFGCYFINAIDYLLWASIDSYTTTIKKENTLHRRRRRKKTLYIDVVYEGLTKLINAGKLTNACQHCPSTA